MKSTTPFILSTLLIAFVSSCKNTDCISGSGHQSTETRKLKSFNKLEIDGAFKINLHQDSTYTAAISADDNLLKNIQTTVSGGKLHITNENAVCNSGDMTLNIGIGKLEAIHASGAVEITTENRLNVKDISLNFTGASKVTLNLSAGKVVTEGAGSTELHLTGQATSHEMDLSGSSEISAFDFIAGSYRIVSAGSSHCQINVLKSLKVDSQGASEIEYKGNPPKIESNKSEASSITKVN